VSGILKRDSTLEFSTPILHSEVKVSKSSEPNPESELDSIREPLFEMLIVI
jgi:hypothetical protein